MSGDSDLLLDHIHSPYHQGPCPHTTVEATAINPLCGDEVQLQLRISNDRIAEAWFIHQGCAISRAGASLLCETVEGQTIATAVQMTDDEFLQLAEVQLSPTRQQCLLLARKALQEILDSITTVDVAQGNSSCSPP